MHEIYYFYANIHLWILVACDVTEVRYDDFIYSENRKASGTHLMRFS